MSDTPRTDAAWARTFQDAENSGNAATDMRAGCATLERELATEIERVRVLRNALENLRDEQNGAPLCTREEQWTQAMDKADAALAATEGAK